MSRPRPHSLAIRLGAAAIAAVAWVAPASAQSTEPAGTNLFSPELDGDARYPPRFGPPGSDKRRPGVLTLPTYGMRPASGAGTTGFDSTNNPRRRTSAPAPRPLPPPPVAQPLQPIAEPVTSISPPTAVIVTPVPMGPPPVRPAEEEESPFDALGWRAGAFLVKPAIELSTGYDTNADRSRFPTASSFVLISPELQVRSDWQRHALNADLRGSYIDYNEAAISDRPSLDAKIDGRLDISRATSVDFEGRLQVGTDEPYSPNVQAGLSRLPIFTTVGATAGLTQRFNRFEVLVKAGVDRTEYEESHFTDGTTLSNADRNFNQYTLRGRAAYESSPGIKPFVEVTSDRRVHDQEFDRFGFDRDSRGLTARAGMSFNLPKWLTGEISAGYTKRNYQDPALAPVSGFILDSSLVWAATPLTNVTFTARSAVNEITLPGESGYLSRDVGVQVEHAFRRWLTGTVKLGLGFDDYECLCRNDQRYLISAGLTYKASRTMHFKGEIRREWLQSTLPTEEYTADIFLIGVRFQR